jgi:hypothetical protein
MNVTTVLHLLSALRISGALPLLPVNAFMAWTGQLFSSPASPGPFKLSYWILQLLICYTA